MIDININTTNSFVKKTQMSELANYDFLTDKKTTKSDNEGYNDRNEESI